jgi:membrane protein DedA with SNARE-associated domain
MIGATLGSSLAFLIARYLLRERIKRALHKRPKFKAVDEAVSEDGWRIVLLLRLSPLVPFNLQNYFFGITEIKFWQYMVATFVGIIPRGHSVLVSRCSRRCTDRRQRVGNRAMDLLRRRPRCHDCDGSPGDDKGE